MTAQIDESKAFVGRILGLALIPWVSAEALITFGQAILKRILIVAAIVVTIVHVIASVFVSVLILYTVRAFIF